MEVLKRMTKEQLILLLKNYKENKAKLKLKLREKESILRKIESLKNVTLSVTSYEENSDIHSKNIITDKVGNKASDNLDVEADLKIELEKVEDEIKELNTKLEEVDIRLDGLRRKEKEILIAYYVEGNTYKEIGSITYYKLYNETRSEETIKKIIQKATEKISKY